MGTFCVFWGRSAMPQMVFILLYSIVIEWQDAHVSRLTHICGWCCVTYKDKDLHDCKCTFLAAAHHHSVRSGPRCFSLSLSSFRLAQWKDNTTHQKRWPLTAFSGQCFWCISSKKYECEVLLWNKWRAVLKVTLSIRFGAPKRLWIHTRRQVTHPILNFVLQCSK